MNRSMSIVFRVVGFLLAAFVALVGLGTLSTSGATGLLLLICAGLVTVTLIPGLRVRLPGGASLGKTAGYWGLSAFLFVGAFALYPNPEPSEPAGTSGFSSTAKSSPNPTQIVAQAKEGSPGATNTPAPTSTTAPTNTPPPTSTPAPTNTPLPTRTPFPTRTPTPGPDELSMQAEMIDAREVALDPDSFEGRNLVYTGRANNLSYHVEQKLTWINFLADIPGEPYDSESMAIHWVGDKIPGLIRGKEIKVFAISQGSETVQIILTGADKKVPSLKAYKIVVLD